MTFIDPSLARGLRKDFWRFVEEDAERTQLALAKIFAHHKLNMPFSEKGFRKFVDDVRKSVAPSTLILTKLDGRRQFMTCFFLDHEPNQSVNEWNEDVLVGIRAIFYRDANNTSVNQSAARIGEHAIQRLFQRAMARTKSSGGFDLGAYSMDIKAVLAWAEPLQAIAKALSEIRKDKALRLFAPTPIGAFLGQVSSDGRWMDFRTFVPVEKMFAEQRKLWGALRNVEAQVGLDHFGLARMGKATKNSPIVKTTLSIFEILRDCPSVAFEDKEIG